MTDNHIKAERPEYTHYARIPNYVDDLDIDTFSMRLYLHLKRVASDDGACWKSTETLAKHCHISMGSVSNAKKALIKAGLIHIEKKDNPHGGKKIDHITIIDIWEKNRKHAKRTTSPHELTTSPHEVATSPDEIKKNPVKNNSVRSRNPADSFPYPENFPQEPTRRIVIETDSEMEKVFMDVTGMVCFPSTSRLEDIRRLKALVSYYGDYGNETTENLKKFYNAWVARGYSKLNTAWLDWAIADRIPTRKDPTKEPEKLSYQQELEKSGYKDIERNPT